MSESDFSVAEALKFAATFELDGCVGTPCEVASVLAAELRRLRAAVEKLADKDQTFHIAYGNDHWVKVSDVLAALEGK